MNSGVYGTAEFEDGMEEIEETTIPSPVATPASAPTTVATVAPVVPVVPVTPATPVTESPVDDEDAVADANAAGNEGLSLTQKALFLVIIGGVVAVYIRMNTRTSSRGMYSQV